MSTIEKVGVALVGVLMVTTLVLPQRQTPAVLKSGSQGVARIFQAASGQRVAVG